MRQVDSDKQNTLDFIAFFWGSQSFRGRLFETANIASGVGVELDRFSPGISNASLVVEPLAQGQHSASRRAGGLEQAAR